MAKFDLSTLSALSSAVRSLFLDGQVLVTLGRQHYPVIVSFAAGTSPDEQAAHDVLVCIRNLNTSPEFQKYLDVSKVHSFQVRVTTSEYDSISEGVDLMGTEIIRINTNDMKRQYLTPDGVWENFNLQHIVNHEIMHPITGLDDGPIHIGAVNDINMQTQGGPLRLSYEDVRCFLAGTAIVMGDGSNKSIELICVGDIIKAFDPENMHDPSALVSRSVTRIFRNIASKIIDLRGLYCTPGHHFLTIKHKNEVKFSRICDILTEDGIIITESRSLIRARTGVQLTAADDALIRVVYRDPSEADHPGPEHCVLVRAGIPLPPVMIKGSLAPAKALAQHLADHGITALADGRLRTPDGTIHDACNWPEGATPFDTHEARNWIVQADGVPYCPPWIRDLVAEDETEGLRVVGALSA